VHRRGYRGSFTYGASGGQTPRNSRTTILAITHLSRLFLKTRTDDRGGLVLHIFSRFRNRPAPAGEA
jgi:hypothetical protein